MSFTVTAFNHAEWKHHRLADYADFADQISERNIGKDAFSGYGEWFFIPDKPLRSGDRVIYSGTWGNDNSPGASCYTYAEIFDMDDPKDVAEYGRRVKHWAKQPEYIDD